VRRSALLVRQFRAPPLYKGAGPELTEAPAGIIDQGETAETAARREAMEETGVVLGELEPVGVVWASAGVSTERIALFLASCAIAERSQGGGKAEEDEHITVLEVPLATLRARADGGEIDDMKLLALVQSLRLKRPELFG
jgi:nudix-type nucleoside diphosphatase (YffH/AdpP family)